MRGRTRTVPQLVDHATREVEDVGCYVLLVAALGDAQRRLVVKQHVGVAQVIHQQLDDVSLVLATLRA